MNADPFFAGEDADAARALAGQATDAELFLYPGGQHLFAGSSLPSMTRTPPHCSPSGCSTSSAARKRSVR